MDTDQKENVNPVLNTSGAKTNWRRILKKSVVFILLLMAYIKFVTVNQTSEDKVMVDSKSKIRYSGVEVVIKHGKKRVKRNIHVPVSCRKSYQLVILENLCSDLFFKNQFCAPGDIHVEKKKKTKKRFIGNLPKEAKVPAIINYAVGGLLITSVGAALLELYKAKKQNPDKGTKSPLSRKCSLADLTVLKHHRKELIRRESIMEVPEDRENNTRQLGFSPPPLLRRCSFPVGPNAGGIDKYGSDTRSAEPPRRISVIEEGSTMAEDRRYSIVGDSRRTSMIESRHSSNVDVRRVSVDDSPEKRHHRLVHRH